MRASRGMGDMMASKMPGKKIIKRKDKPQDVEMYAKGGKVGLYANINAKRERIKIIRKVGNDTVEYGFSFGAYAAGKAPESNLILKPGDTVVVPE